MRFSLAVAILLALAVIEALAVPASAQSTEPTTVSITGVPEYVSGPHNVTFINPSSSDLTVAVTVTGPFALSTNRCANGVRPGTHCNIDVVFVPQTLGEVTGDLIFTYNDGQIIVPLSGNALTIIPTTMNVTNDAFDITMYADGEVIPNGELVYDSCFDWEGVNQFSAKEPLKNNRINDMPPGRGYIYNPWECGFNYEGDGQFAASGEYYYISCHPTRLCGE